VIAPQTPIGWRITNRRASGTLRRDGLAIDAPGLLGEKFD